MKKSANATKSVTACRTCNSSAVEAVLDFGLQPLSNRFRTNGDSTECRHPLILGFCINCGLVQLTSTVPVEEIRPRFKWISYNEPEGHLDKVADTLALLPGLTNKSKIVGLTYKEDSLLKRMQARGFTNVQRFDLQKDFGIYEPMAGSETLQERFTEQAAQTIVGNYGKSDLVIARHILEHSYKPHEFLAAIKALVSPSGYVMLEVPDSENFLKCLDYSFIWEEHSLYFTLHTFRSTLAQAGFNFVSLNSFPYPYENCLVAILSAESNSNAINTSTNIEREEARIRLYAEKYFEQKDLHRKTLSYLTNKRGKLAIFGAGHLAAHFINFLDLAEFIEFVLDDHPEKVGLKMPGSDLPIVHSNSLRNSDIRTYFSSLSPESHLKLCARQSEFLANGGKIYSIPRASESSIRLPFDE